MTKYPLVTLCGSWNLSRHWVMPCIKSWQNIQNIDHQNYFLVPDTNLNQEDAKHFEAIGFKVFDDFEVKLKDLLSNLPYLDQMRDADLTWRKIVDVSFLMKGKGKVVLIDTDVLITQPCYLPSKGFDICYMREDIPAYRANWKIVWKEAMIPVFNAGIVIFDADQVDFAHLNRLCEKYFLSCKDYWWTEQSAWACIAGGLKNPHFFSGENVRVLSGFKKRSPNEVIQNTYKYFGMNLIIDDFEDFKPYLLGAVIIHFAGLGKKHFTETFNYFNQLSAEKNTARIIAIPDQWLTFKDKFLIGLRLFLKEIKK